MTGIPRRHLLTGLGGLGLLTLMPRPRAATRGDLEPVYRELFGERRPEEDGGVELEVAQLVESGNSVSVTVRSLAEPPPSALHLLMPGNPEAWGASFAIRPPALPVVSTRVRLSSTQNLTAVAEWPDGRLRATGVSVMVTRGACVDENYERWVRREGGDGRPAPAIAPARDRSDDHVPALSARVRVPEEARPGEQVEVRTLADHPMETGYRVDTSGARVPRNILTRLRCTYADRLVFDAALRPAIAANPYVTFAFVADVSGDVVLEWEGDHGEHLVERRHLEVVSARDDSSRAPSP